MGLFDRFSRRGAFETPSKREPRICIECSRPAIEDSMCCRIHKWENQIERMSSQDIGDMIDIAFTPDQKTFEIEDGVLVLYFCGSPHKINELARILDIRGKSFERMGHAKIALKIQPKFSL